MPHTYGPQFDLGPEGYHARCALCGYEYGTHMAVDEHCPVKFERPDKYDDQAVDYHPTQKFQLRPPEGG